FGFGVEVKVEQNIDVRPGAISDGFEMHAKITQYLAIDIDLRRKGHAETGPPALRSTFVIGKDVGLQRGKFFGPDFVSNRLYAVEISDRWLVPVGMVDAPSGTMRPVDANAIADLAAEQFVAGYPE